MLRFFDPAGDVPHGLAREVMDLVRGGGFGKLAVLAGAFGTLAVLADEPRER